MTKYSEIATKVARIQHIKQMIGHNRQWALRALTRIYSHQTSEEQTVGETRYHNGVGFNGADANILSSFAEQVNRGRTLSDKQMRIVFAKMPKYARQLESLTTQPVDQTEQVRDPDEEENRSAA